MDARTVLEEGGGGGKKIDFGINRYLIGKICRLAGWSLDSLFLYIYSARLV